MLKKAWRKLLAAGCVVSLLMSVPGVSVLAEEPQDEMVVSTAEAIEEIESQYEKSNEDEELSEAGDIDIQETDDQVVGAGRIVVGDNVTATFDSSTGELGFYSNFGTLWKDWRAKSGIDVYYIKSIKVVSGTVYLPEDSSRIFAVYEAVQNEDHYIYNSNLNSLDLHGFDTSNVTNMSEMFYNCINLTSLDLSSFDTSNVTDMSGMFHNCFSLTSLDLSSFDTSNVTDMSAMFEADYQYEFDSVGYAEYGNSLLSLDLNSFDTTNVKNMSCMFYRCVKLKNLNISHFNTFNVSNMTSMFQYCRSLISLDLSSFDMTNVTNKSCMIDSVNNLRILKTPKNNYTYGINLPASMCDSEGNEYSELPALSSSIVLHKIIGIANCVVTVTPTAYVYDGKAKLPNVIVKDGEDVLIKDTDYTIEYTDNTNAGTGTVTVTGMRYYIGQVNKTFSIGKAKPVLKFASSSLTNKTTDAAFTNALTKTTDGTVTFKSSNTGIATVNSTSGKVTIKGVGTTIITATATEGSNYKAGSASYTLTVGKGSIDISGCTTTLSTASYTYNGKEKKPAVTMQDGMKKLTLGTDYSVVYGNNINAGTATATVTGIGAYTGTKTLEFTIKKAAPTLKFAVDPT